MGVLGLFFFGEEDVAIIESIAKAHKLPKEYVEKHYKSFIEKMVKEANED